VENVGKDLFRSMEKVMALQSQLKEAESKLKIARECLEKIQKTDGSMAIWQIVDEALEKLNTR